MKHMESAQVDTHYRISDFGDKRGDIVFLGEIQPIGNSTLVVASSIKKALRGKTVVMNLESPVCSAIGESCSAKKSILPSFAIDVDEFKKIIKAFDIDYKNVIVNIANNHSSDTGSDGIEMTTNELEALGCRVIGTLKRPHCMVDGVRIIGCTSRLNILGSPHAKQLIQPDDIPNDKTPTIVYIHWGWEYYEDPDADSVALAKQLSNMTGCFPNNNIIGIVGHGPHLLQKVCKYKNTICAYSLGDTVVRSKRPVSIHNPRALSGMLQIALHRQHISGMHMTPLLQSHSDKHIKLHLANTSDSLARYKSLR